MSSIVSKKKTSIPKMTRPVKLSAKQLVIPILLFLIIQLAITLFVAFLDGEGYLPEGEMGTIATFSSALFGLAAVIICDKKLLIFALLPDAWTGKQETKNLIPAVIVCLFLAVSVNIFLNGIIFMSGIPKIDGLYKSAASSFAEGSYAFRVLTYGIMVPVAEESLFRGIVYKFFKSRFYGRRHYLAILLTSLTFGVYHGNVTQGIYTLLLSILFCLLVDRGGLILSVAAHLMVNLASLLGGKIDYYSHLITAPEKHIPVIIACALVSFILYFVLARFLPAENRE